MTARVLSGREDLERSLRRIGESLAGDVRAYLIGGCAMMLYNAKIATKDIDLVLLSPGDAESLVDALSRIGFKMIVPGDETYRRLGATIIMEDDRGMRIDTFVETVCRKLRVTSGMVARSKLHSKYGRLEIRLISPEDIFLFKSMTEREGDLDDMALLAERGLDWQAILDECVLQSSEVILEGFLAVRLQELEEEKGIASPIRANLEEIAERKLSSARDH